MTNLKGWFITATILAFIAGGGTGLVADRITDSNDDGLRSGDSDGYLEVFESKIGIENDAQRRALRAAYDRYFRDLQELTGRIAAQHREELNRIDRAFWQRVNQQLDEKQRRRWQELTRGIMGEVGPADPDTGGDEPSNGESSGE